MKFFVFANRNFQFEHRISSCITNYCTWAKNWYITFVKTWNFELQLKKIWLWTQTLELKKNFHLQLIQNIMFEFEISCSISKSDGGTKNFMFKIEICSWNYIQFCLNWKFRTRTPNFELHPKLLGPDFTFRFTTQNFKFQPQIWSN